MSNPRVRPHLRTLPEDTGSHLSQPWQGARWKDELDPDLATPMVRHAGEDFYVYEPTPTLDGRVCMPVRWFTRGEETLATVWEMEHTVDKQGWIVLKHRTSEVNVREFAACWENFKESFRSRGVPDPRNIIGIPLIHVCCMGKLDSQSTPSRDSRNTRWRDCAVETYQL